MFLNSKVLIRLLEAELCNVCKHKSMHMLCTKQMKNLPFAGQDQL